MVINMRKFFSISLITLALVVCAVGVTSVAPVVVHAQGATTQAAVPASGANPINGVLPNPAGSSGILVGVIQWIMMLFAWLVGVAALALDYAVYYTVVTMGNYVHNLTAIGVVWRILRDISNIALIFGFLAIGIATILDTEKFGWKTKMLPMLLIAAVFLNFSLFISEAVIDAGNMFATEFYTQINGGVLPTAVPSGAIATNGITLTPTNEGISNRIMGQLGLQTIYNVNTNTGIFKDSNSWIIGFLGIILFLITAFVMFSLAFILIARFITLIFLIIVAPIGFAGLAIPMLSKQAGQWWSMLFEQTITAPVLLLMLYIALAVITDVHFLTGFGVTNGSASAWTSWFSSGGLAGFASMLLSFLVAMGLLLAVVVFAKKIGAAGAGWATKMGGRLSFGAVSFAGRATLGSAGNVLAGKHMQSWARKNYALRPLVLAGKGLRSATYDVRNAPGVTKGLGAFAGAIAGSLDVGTGAKLTAKQAHEAQYGLKPVKAWFAESKEEREQAGRDMDFKKAQNAIEEEKKKLIAGTITQAQYDTNIEPHEQIITNALSKMSYKQIEELGGIRKGTEALVRNLSPEQFESLMKSDKFSDTEKENMRANRYRSLNAAITAGDKTAVRQWSAKDLATAAPDILNNPVQAASLVNLMSDGQFDAVIKNDKLSKGQQQQLRNFSSQGKLFNFLDISHGNPPRTPALVTAGIIPAGMTPAAASAAAAGLIGPMSPKKLAKLHGAILTDPIAMALFTPKHLAAFMTDGDLDPGEISTIATAVRNPAHPNHAAIMSYLNPATNPIAASYWA